MWVFKQGLCAASSCVAAAVSASVEQSADEAAGAADSTVDGECGDGTVERAGSAFHAGIEVDDLCLAVADGEYVVWADGKAQSAAGAFFLVQFQCGNIFEIFHKRPSSTMQIVPAIPASSWRGMAIFISFFTPDMEV